MNLLKKFAGVLCIVLGVVAIVLMVMQAGKEIAKNPVLDTKMFWYIIIPIFSPIMLGLCLFGWYGLKGEYDRIEN